MTTHSTNLRDYQFINDEVRHRVRVKMKLTKLTKLKAREEKRGYNNSLVTISKTYNLLKINLNGSHQEVSDEERRRDSQNTK